MKNVVIAGYVRSPFTPARKGELVKVRPDDFAAQTVRGLVERTGVVIRAARPEGVVVGALDDGDGVNLDIAQFFDRLGDALFARGQFCLAVEELGVQDRSAG